MSDILTIKPKPLEGGVSAIASKSVAHRLLISAALGNSAVRILDSDLSKDIAATLSCLKQLGFGVEKKGDVYSFTQLKNAIVNPELDCGECGATFRFLLPISSVICENVRFWGRGKLAERPIGELVNVMRTNGVTFTAENLPFSISGKLRSGEYVLAGDISSQYISGLLFALPLLEGDSVIRLTTPLQSRSYVEMTLDAIRKFGIVVEKNGEWEFHVKGGQTYKNSQTSDVEGDWSNAAFFLAAGAVSGDVSVAGLDLSSRQGDRKIVDILKKMNANVTTDENVVRVQKSDLKGTEIDLADIPDLFPVLAVVAAVAEGESVFLNTSRLRLKESDRIKSVCDMLCSLGFPEGNIKISEYNVAIQGGRLLGGDVDSYNDHRIVMSAAVAAAVTKNAVTIRNYKAVEKSYPLFFNDYKKIGGEVDVDISR